MNDNPQPNTTRRALLRNSFVAGAAALSTQRMLSTASAQDEPILSPRGKALRVAHLTDPHVNKDPQATFGFASALQTLALIKPAPAFMIGGGDHVFDTFAVDYFDAVAQWDLYFKLFHDNTQIPMYPLVGNHDIFGWGDPLVSERMAGYGKALAMERLGLHRAYYSFDAGGWHFICLDNIIRRIGSYFGGIDAEQYQWLQADFKATGTKTPICIFSHLPLLSAASTLEPNNAVNGGIFLSGMLTLQDPRALIELMLSYNVRLCLSGHLHTIDRVEYRGITYICDGAVCGDWWRGPRMGHPPGFGIIDYWPDGGFEHTFHTYPWQAK